MKPADIQDLILQAKRPAFDFNGTIDINLFVPPRDGIVITGSKEDDPYVLDTCTKFGIPRENIYFHNDEKYDNKQIAQFKADKCRELGCDMFFENNPAEVYWIRKFAPGVQVIYIHRRNYVIFTYSFDGLTYAYRLKQEGNPVVMAVMEPSDAGFTLKDDNDRELDKRRISRGDGMVKKFPAATVFRFLKSIEDKEDYFVDFDFNYGSNYAEKIEKMGFKGFFPRKEAQELEKDRQKGQDIVKKNYKLLRLPEEQEFKKVDDALKSIEGTDKTYVVKPNNPDFTCFVPLADYQDNGAFQQEIKNYFDETKQGLESQGFILQEKVEKPIEVAPECCYVNGAPVALVGCIESKPFGSGDIGPQTGCACDLDFVLEPDSKLVEIGLKDYFPIAQKDGITNYVDAGILFDQKDGTPYFTEFCHSRKSYNAFLTELSMMPSVSQYFDCIINGVDPFQGPGRKRFGASIRIFNLAQDDDRFVKPELKILGDSPNIWFTDVKMVDDDIVTAGYSYETVIVTGVGDSAEEAIQECKKHTKEIILKEMYHRSDLEDKDQWFNILYRYHWLKEHELL